MATRNDITGDKIQSRISNKQFEDNFDAIFRKPKETPNTVDITKPAPDKPVEPTQLELDLGGEWDERRLDIIGQNGPIGYADTENDVIFNDD